MPETHFDVLTDEFRQFFLQAQRGRVVVGSAEGYPDSPEVLYIKWLGVEPRFRRHGYGAAMVRELEHLARGWGYHSIALNPQDRRAADFWEAMGFRMRQGEPHGKWYKSLDEIDLSPNRPDVGPPLPRELRLFWPGQPVEP